MSRFCLLILFLTCAGTLAAQGFQAPSKGKAVVYLVRPTNYQRDINTLVFDGDKFIADFQGTQYFRYECEPGKHVFWVSAENVDFVVADLNADSSYAIFIETLAGSMMPKVKVSPMPPTHKKFHMAKWLITNKAAVTEDSGVVDAENERMAAFIQRTMTQLKQSPDFNSRDKYLGPGGELEIGKYQ